LFRTVGTVFSCKQCLICAYFSPDSEKITFSLERESITIDYGLFIYLWIFWPEGTFNDGFLFFWCASDVMLIFSNSSSEETNSSTSWMIWGWVNFPADFHFWVNYSFKQKFFFWSLKFLKWVRLEFQITNKNVINNKNNRKNSIGVLSRERGWCWLLGCPTKIRHHSIPFTTCTNIWQ